MINLALFFAILQGISIGSYITLQKYGSTNINSALGAMIVSAVAFFINLLVLFGMKVQGQPINFSSKGIVLLVLMGLTAAGNDLFGLVAYSKGLTMLASFMVIGIYSCIIIFAGLFFLKESFNPGKLLAIVLILAGIILFQKSGI